MTAAPLVIEYFAWELAVTALCLTALARVHPLALKLSLLIGLNITVSAFCAMVLSFFHFNSPMAYFVLAAVFSACAIALGWRRRGELLQSLEWRPGYPRGALALWFALASC